MTLMWRHCNGVPLQIHSLFITAFSVVECMSVILLMIINVAFCCHLFSQKTGDEPETLSPQVMIEDQTVPGGSVVPSDSKDNSGLYISH